MNASLLGRRGHRDVNARAAIRIWNGGERVARTFEKPRPVSGRIAALRRRWLDPDVTVRAKAHDDDAGARPQEEDACHGQSAGDGQ